MEFIQLYADVDNGIDIVDDIDDEQVLVSKDCYTLIEDSEQKNGNNLDFYRGFENVTRNLNETIDDFEEWLDQRGLQPENSLTHDQDRNEIEFDEFDDIELRNKKFRSKMLMYQKSSYDSFYDVVLHALVFKIRKKLDFVTNGNKIKNQLLLALTKK